MLSRKLIFLLIIKEQSVLAVKFKFTAQMNRNELDIKRPTTLQSLIDSFSGNQAPIEIVYKSCVSDSVVNCKTSDLQKKDIFQNATLRIHLQTCQIFHHFIYPQNESWKHWL